MWDRATVFFFQDGNGKNYLIDGGSSSVDADRKIPVGTIFKIPGREEAGLCVGDAWGCGSLKCSGRTSGTEKVWSRNPVSDFFRNRNIGMKGLLNYVIWQKRQERRYG